MDGKKTYATGIFSIIAGVATFFIAPGAAPQALLLVVHGLSSIFIRQAVRKAELKIEGEKK